MTAAVLPREHATCNDCGVDPCICVSINALPRSRQFFGERRDLFEIPFPSSPRTLRRMVEAGPWRGSKVERAGDTVSVTYCADCTRRASHRGRCSKVTVERYPIRLTHKSGAVALINSDAFPDSAEVCP